jgi:hypothetical protein
MAFNLFSISRCEHCGLFGLTHSFSRGNKRTSVPRGPHRSSLREGVERQGLFYALYRDCGSHLWLTPKVGRKIHPLCLM